MFNFLLLRPQSFNWFADSSERQHRYQEVIEQVGFVKKEEHQLRQQQEEEQQQQQQQHEQEGEDGATPRKRGRPRVKREAPEDDEAMLLDDGMDAGARMDDESISDGAGDPSSRMRRIRPDAVQWLSIADYTTGLFLHYDALKVHFERVAEEEGCYFARLLNKEFCSEHNRLYFTILQPMLTEISDLKSHLAAREAHRAAAAARSHGGAAPTEADVEEAAASSGQGLCEQIEALFASLASQVLRPDLVASKTVDELCEVEPAGAALLGVNQVNYGPNFATILDASPLPQSEKAKIKSAAAAFLRELFSGLQSVLRNALMIIRSSEHFQLPNFLNVELEERHIAAPFFEQDEDTIAQVLAKYRLMKMLDWKNRRSTLAFWQDVHDFGDSTGNFPLRVVSTGVWKMLCVPLFNEQVSRVQRQVNEMRRSLSSSKGLDPDVLESLLVVKSGLRRLGKDVAHFQPPHQLVKDHQN